MARRKITSAGAFAAGGDIARLLLRLVFGLSMILGHGWPKLMKLTGDGPVSFGDPIGVGPLPSLFLAIFAEVLCAALLVVGWLTRAAAVPLIITMLVAVFIVHVTDPFAKMEMGILYLCAYLVIFILGPGRYSLDAMLKK